MIQIHLPRQKENIQVFIAARLSQKPLNSLPFQVIADGLSHLTILRYEANVRVCRRIHETTHPQPVGRPMYKDLHSCCDHLCSWIWDTVELLAYECALEGGEASDPFCNLSILNLVEAIGRNILPQARPRIDFPKIGYPFDETRVPAPPTRQHEKLLLRRKYAETRILQGRSSTWQGPPPDIKLFRPPRKTYTYFRRLPKWNIGPVNFWPTPVSLHRGNEVNSWPEPSRRKHIWLNHRGQVLPAAPRWRAVYDPVFEQPEYPQIYLSHSDTGPPLFRNLDFSFASREELQPRQLVVNPIPRKCQPLRRADHELRKALGIRFDRRLSPTPLERRTLYRLQYPIKIQRSWLRSPLLPEPTIWASLGQQELYKPAQAYEVVFATVDGKRRAVAYKRSDDVEDIFEQASTGSEPTNGEAERSPQRGPQSGGENLSWNRASTKLAPLYLGLGTQSRLTSRLLQNLVIQPGLQSRHVQSGLLFDRPGSYVHQVSMRPQLGETSRGASPTKETGGNSSAVSDGASQAGSPVQDPVELWSSFGYSR